MAEYSPYQEFNKRLTLLISKHPSLVTTTLSNIITMRLISNKTHGDLAAIAIPEFINQYMYDYSSLHMGKDRFRAKKQEEDISVVNQITNEDYEYICEVRYGGAAANALQRGLWTNTRNAIQYFDSITGGWIDYSHNLILVKLFSHALVASKRGHIEALEIVKRDIASIIQGEGL